MSFDGAKLKSRLQYINASDVPCLLGLYYGDKVERFANLNQLTHPFKNYQMQFITKYSYFTPYSFTDEQFHAYSRNSGSQASKAGVKWESTVFDALLQSADFPQEFTTNDYQIIRNETPFVKDGFSSTPDGLVKDKDGKIVCVIEIKTTNEENFNTLENHDRYKIQNIVQMKTTGAERGIIFIMARNEKNNVIHDKTIIINQEINTEECQSILKILPILKNDVEIDKEVALLTGFPQEFTQDDNGMQVALCNKDIKINQALSESYITDKQIEEYLQLEESVARYNDLKKIIQNISSSMLNGEKKIIGKYMIVSKARQTFETEESVKAKIIDNQQEIARLELKIKNKNYEIKKPTGHFQIKSVEF